MKNSTKYFDFCEIQSLVYCPNGYIRSKNSKEDKFDLVGKYCVFSNKHYIARHLRKIIRTNISGSKTVIMLDSSIDFSSIERKMLFYDKENNKTTRAVYTFIALRSCIITLDGLMAERLSEPINWQHDYNHLSSHPDIIP